MKRTTPIAPTPLPPALEPTQRNGPAPGAVSQTAAPKARPAVRDAVWLAGLVLLSRLLFSFLVFPALTTGTQLLNTTPDDYDNIASNLAAGRGYVLAPDTAPTMQRLPLYPLFLTLSFALFGATAWPVQLAHALVDATSALLLYRIADRIYGDRRVSRLAVLIFTVYPGALVAAGRIVTEPLYTFLLLLAVLLFLRARQRPTLGNLGSTGAVLGLCALCKSAGLFLPLVLVPLTMQSPLTRRFRPAVRAGAILFGAMALMLSPWVARNYLLVGHLLPTATIGGSVVYDAFYIASRPSETRPFFESVDLSKREQYQRLREAGIETVSPTYPFWFLAAQDEYRWNSLMYRTVTKGLLATPSTLARALANNAIGFWFVGRIPTATALNVVLHLPLLLLASVGLRRSLRDGRAEAWVLVAVITYFHLFHTLSLGIVRYAVPVMPFVAMLAANGLAGARLSEKSPRS